jgi:hypothetical protein
LPGRKDSLTNWSLSAQVMTSGRYWFWSLVAVPERQLLLAVGRVIHGVQVEGQATGRRVKGADQLVEENVT